MGRQVYINKTECKGCGSCEEVYPEAFKMDDEGEKADLAVDAASLDAELLERVVSICPTNCIEVILEQEE